MTLIYDLKRVGYSSSCVCWRLVLTPLLTLRRVSTPMPTFCLVLETLENACFSEDYRSSDRSSRSYVVIGRRNCM